MSIYPALLLSTGVAQHRSVREVLACECECRRAERSVRVGSTRVDVSPGGGGREGVERRAGLVAIGGGAKVMINTSASDTLSHATRRSGRALSSSKTRAGAVCWLTSLIRTTFDLATAGQGGTVRSLTGVGQTKYISKSDWRHLTTHNHNNCAFVGAIKSSSVCATGRKRMPCALASSEKRRFLRAVTPTLI